MLSRWEMRGGYATVLRQNRLVDPVEVLQIPPELVISLSSILTIDDICGEGVLPCWKHGRPPAITA
eukprot:5283440-Prorocentrum_lima.AAC.1